MNVCFSAVLSKQAVLVGLVVDKGLHAYGDKWVAIVIVMAVHMCVGQDVGIGLQLAQEKQLTFNLGEKLAPKMRRHGGRAPAEHADHVVLECLDGLLGKVATMVIGRTRSYVILVSSILVLYANDAWLLSIWCCGTIPRQAIHASA